MEPKNLTFEEIFIGDRASFERVFNEDDVRVFAGLSGDYNPLHLDAVYAGTTTFGRPVVHGMLVASLCSALVGMYLPGKRCLYLAQTLEFRKPVFVGDTLEVVGVVTAKSPSTRVLTIAISITREGEKVLYGVATAKVLE